jgi:hypothetical protein
MPRNRTTIPQVVANLAHFRNHAERRKNKPRSVSVPLLYYDFVDRNKYNPKLCRAAGKR